MGTDDHVKVVLGEEAFHTVGSEFDDVTCLRGISKVVSIYSKLTVGLSGVRPKDIKYYLRLFILYFMHYFKGTINLLDIFKGIQRCTNTSV